MRPAVRLLRPAARAGANYLTPFNPTGIAGIVTHPTPRQELIILYNQTLDKLSKLPDISAYRTATEALTKHRLAIVESHKPDGYDEWVQRFEEQIQNNPAMFRRRGDTKVESAGPYSVIIAHRQQHTDPRETEWEGEPQFTFEEGVGEPGDYKDRVFGVFAEALKEDEPAAHLIQFEEEPPLTTQQITEIEDKIGAGLIEEVIQVAEGELLCADEMLKAKVWENLEEVPAPGQWQYFEREWFVQKTQTA